MGYAQSKTLPKKNSNGPFVRPDCPNTNVLKYIMKMIQKNVVICNKTSNISLSLRFIRDAIKN